MMKLTIKRLFLLLMLVIALSIVVYNRDIIGNNPRIRNAEINHGYSSIFTIEEIDLAMEVVLEDFVRSRDWNNELISLWYDEERADLFIQTNRHLRERLYNEEIRREDIIILFGVFDTGQGSFRPRLRQDWVWYIQRNSSTGEWRITNQGKW